MKARERRYLTAVDLFAGCGGLSKGLRLARVNAIGAVEFDPLAAESYRRNHPSTLLLETDIRHVSGTFLLDALGLEKGELDILAGCPPCQGFSRMTKRNKANPRKDPRNSLIFEMLRLVRALKPKVILMENVPAFEKHWRFKKFVRELRRAKYECSFDVLNAARYGVPQRRRRLILVASRLGPVQLPEPTDDRVTVRDAIKTLPPPSKSTDSLHRSKANHSKEVRALIKSIPKNGGSRRDLGKDRQLDCHKRIKGFNDVYGRMRWDDISPTITGSSWNPSKGRFLHPERNRAISLREAAVIQSFPRDYWFPPLSKTSKQDVGLLVGNAVPPTFAKHQAEQIRAHLLSEAVRQKEPQAVKQR